MDLDELLKSIREEGNSTGGKIVPAKFLGGDRYEKYAEELAQEGTLDGDRLTRKERIEGVRAYRKGKIDFKTFVDKVLSTKKAQSVGSSGGPKSIGSGGGALVVRKKTISADDIKSGSSVETEQNLDEILKGIDSIRETLKKEEDLKKKQASDSKKSEERRKRKAKEDKLEGSVFKGLANQTKKVFAPVKSILDRMIDFFTKILIGRFLVKLIGWMTDKENQKKLKALGFLLEKTWPALVTAFVLFGTAFGGLVRTILGLALKFTGKLIGAAARLAIKNPLAAAAVAVVGGAAIGGIMQSQTQSNDAERAAQGKTQLDDTLEFGGATGDPMGALMFNSGGLAPAPKGTDTVPAMLTPGEFVMSKGAVDAFGTDFMESLNSLGGGTNKPKRSNGTLYASSGGSTKEEPGGRNKKKPESSGGMGSFFSNLFAKKPDSKKNEEKKDTKASPSGKIKGNTSGTNEERWKAFYAMGQKSGAKYPQLVAAQYALESGWGSALSARNNFFGIKATGSESATVSNTREVINGQNVYMDERFKNFETPQESVNHLVTQWYKDYRGYKGVNNAPSAFAAADQLRAEGYATDPGYARALKRLLNQYADVTGDEKDIAAVSDSGFIASSPTSSGGLSPSSSSSSSSGASSIAASLKTIRSYLGSSSGGQTAQLGKNTPSISTPTPPVRSQPKVQTINSGSESGGQAESLPLLSSDTPFIPSPPASAEKMLVMGLPA